MNTSEFDKHKVDHLFLLIGENPLPNYVAVRLLLNQKWTVYLVYTSGTEIPATCLQNILIDEFKRDLGIEEKEAQKLVQLKALEENESDAYKIQKAILEKLEEIKDGKIGLHYTGGTKAMSVHTYRALFYEKKREAWWKDI